MTDKPVDIRCVQPEEMLDLLFSLTSYAFHASPPVRERGDWDEAVLARKGTIYHALFEGETGVASVASSAMSQQVRGAIYPAGGVWGVVTHPAARRKGYCRRLMARLLAADREEGHALSCLYPFRESFYEKLGYVTFPLPRIAKLKPAALAPLLRQDLGGEVELLLIGDGYDTYRHFVRRLQQRTHGLAYFVHGQKEQVQKRSSSWLALVRVDGELAGLMLYQLQGQDVGRFTLRATRFYYDTAQARYLLLQWLARHVDQAGEIEIWLPPFEQPETWLADMQVTTESQKRAPMGRIVDVARIGGMSTGPGCFAARIADPLCPWNEGAWRFETVDGVLQVGPAAEPGCDLTIQALTALIYGTHDPGDFALRGWGDPPAGLQAAMRTMFPPRVPFMHEYF
jgi:predicted acetyltransferase